MSAPWISLERAEPPTVVKCPPYLNHAVRLLAAVLTITWASQAGAESLADAVASAYAHNPDLVQQRYTQKAVDENYVQARSQYGPQLEAQATGGYTRDWQGGQSLGSNSGEAIVTLSQTLYTSGRLRGQMLAARAEVSAGQQALRQVEQQTVENVIIVYAAVLRDEQRLEVGRQNVLVLQDQLRENQERYNRVGKGVGAGDVTLTDVGQADSRLAGAESELADLEAALTVSRAQYLQVVGRNPGTLDPLPDLVGMPASIDAAYAEAQANNPTLLTAEYQEQQASATAASVRGALGPSVSLTARGLYDNQLVPFSGQLGTKEVAAMVTITQPLFSSGTLHSQVRQADDQDAANQAAVESARRAAIESVTSAWSQLVDTRQELVAGTRQVASAQLAFAGMHREELYGLRSTIDTLNAEQELVAAQLGLLESRYEEYVSRAQLLASIGGLFPDRIVAGLDVYDPADHFRHVRNKGRTPLEPIAMALDRLGSANPRRPLIADLTGADSPVPAAIPALPPTPGPALSQEPLVPLTESPLVPASKVSPSLLKTAPVPPKGLPATEAAQ